MRMNYRHALAACALVFSPCAIAYTDITVNALQHCLSTDTMTGHRTSIQLRRGRYVVSLLGNTMNCTTQTVDCRIDTIIVQSPRVTTLPVPAYWGLAIKDTIAVELPGPTTFVTIDAFVIDPYCADNTGSATLRFYRVPQ